MKIGKYNIENGLAGNHKVWIGDNGEGGDFDRVEFESAIKDLNGKALEEAVDKFYNDNF